MNLRVRNGDASKAGRTIVVNRGTRLSMCINAEAGGIGKDKGFEGPSGLEDEGKVWAGLF